MLGRVGKGSHVIVGLAVLVAPVAIALGLVGRGDHPERFDAKQVVVWPASAEGVRIREVVDQDFGSHDRHGYERIIPVDFGTPTDITASSPDANADIGTADTFTTEEDLRIRLGDPDTTYDGQHRYVLSYTLPAAQLSSGHLAIDIIGGGEEFETGRFEVVVAGFELTNTKCFMGYTNSKDECTLTKDGDVYRVVFEPLQPYHGITIEGDIASMTTGEPDIPIPPIPDRRTDWRFALAGGSLVLGALVALTAYVLARRTGRNEVGGLSASDAAFVGTAATGANAMATRLVTDAELAEMATTEFAPPTGMRPWQGALLLNEVADNNTVSAWFSEQIAREHVLFEKDPKPTLKLGSKLGSAPEEDRQRISDLLGVDGEIQLGKYSAEMATLWKSLAAEQKEAAKASGWWKDGMARRYPFGLGALLCAVVVVVGFCAWRGWWSSWPMALGLGVALAGLAAGISYAAMLPARTAVGSALVLRVESFRRFLALSEGQHVQWAYSQGLLREYSAWAVALGAADAWNKAVLASNIPSNDMMLMTAPLMVHSYASSFATAHTAPSQSSGGGGFSGGGFSGGGGGGGSSGSW